MYGIHSTKLVKVFKSIGISRTITKNSRLLAGCHEYSTDQTSKNLQIGFGTYTSLGDVCVSAVSDAIDAGYRLIDTAYFYQNEREVGEAVRKKIELGAVKREQMFIVSKLWCHMHDPQIVEYAYCQTLKNIGLDYIDLYLMHWPFSFRYDDDDVLMPQDSCGRIYLSDVDYLETWKAMEKLVEGGLVKNIGLSNFNCEQLSRLLDDCKIRPFTNQIECNPQLQQKSMIELCKENNIGVMAYCPLGRPDPVKERPEFLYHLMTKAIGEKYDKTPAQVVLRYLIEIGVVPIPKSVNKDRIKENIDIFNFKLDEKDKGSLEYFNTGFRIIWSDFARDSIYYPFHEK